MIEKEAKEYANIPESREIDSDERYYNTHSVEIYDAFISGSKSKSVRVEKIEAHISAYQCFDYLDERRVREIILELKNELEKLI